MKTTPRSRDETTCDDSCALSRLPRGTPAVVRAVGGERSLRRRLMEMGLLPGARVTVTGAAPFGDPLKLKVRSYALSIRRAEASLIDVRVDRDARIGEGGS